MKPDFQDVNYPENICSKLRKNCLFWTIIRNLFSFLTEKYRWKKFVESYSENLWKHVSSIIYGLTCQPPGESNSLYICLQELRLILFSVVNMTEKLQCCQLDLGLFLAWFERFIQRNHEKQKNMSFFFLSLQLFLMRGNYFHQNKLLKIIL